MNDGKAVLVTTEFRGIFFGYVVDDSKLPEQITLENVRNYKHGVSVAGHVPIWALGDGYGAGYGDGDGYGDGPGKDIGKEIEKIIAQGKRHERRRD